MKKVLSLLLAVVLVCSMATVALATNNDVDNKCSICGFTSDDIFVFTAHKNSKECAKCPYCKDAGCQNADEYQYHKYNCEFADIFCDYCGKTQASEKIYDEHINACKKSHFFVPLGLIIEHVKAYFGKLDFKKILAEGKSFFGYVINIGKDVAGTVAK